MILRLIDLQKEHKPKLDKQVEEDLTAENQWLKAQNVAAWERKNLYVGLSKRESSI